MARKASIENEPGTSKSYGTIGFEAQLWLTADKQRLSANLDFRDDYVLTNPPINDSDWFRKNDEVRWQFGGALKGNANFAWVQHFIHHLAPSRMH